MDLTEAKKNVQSIGYDLLIDINNQEDLDAVKAAELAQLKKNTLYSGIFGFTCVFNWHDLDEYPLCQCNHVGTDYTHSSNIWEIFFH